MTHQYPQRDEPFTEDLGRAAREYEISAFVLGEDCVDQAYAVRDAIEQPGPGTLVHPEFGEVQVIARPGGSMSFSQTRRIVRFTLTFVEAGLNSFPEMGQATQSQSRAAADGLMSSACDAFAEAISLDAVEDFVKDALNGDLLDSLGIISNSEIAEVLGMSVSAVSHQLRVLRGAKLVKGDAVPAGNGIRRFPGLQALAYLATQQPV